jgi:membrane peptidoglycan carboxypeptidase
MDADNGGRHDGAGAHESDGPSADHPMVGSDSGVASAPMSDEPVPRADRDRPETAAGSDRNGAAIARRVSASVARTGAGLRAGTRWTATRVRAGAATALGGVRVSGAKVGSGLRTVAARTGSGIRAATVTTGSGIRTVATRTGSGIRTVAARTASGIRTVAARTGSGIRAATVTTGSGIRAGAGRAGAGLRAGAVRTGSGIRGAVAGAKARTGRTADGLRATVTSTAASLRSRSAARAERKRARTEARAEVRRAKAEAKQEQIAARMTAERAEAQASVAVEQLQPGEGTVAAEDQPGPAEPTAPPNPTQPGPRRVDDGPTEAGRVEASPAEASPAEASPAEANPAEASPAEANPAEAGRVEASPAEANPAEADISGAEAAATPVPARPEPDQPADVADTPTTTTTDAPSVPAIGGDEAEATDPAAPAADDDPPESAGDDVRAPVVPTTAGEALARGAAVQRSAVSRATDRTVAAVTAPARWHAHRRAAARERSTARATARLAAREQAATQAEAARQAALESAALRRAALRRAARRRTVLRLVARDRARRVRRRRIAVAVAVAVLMGSAGMAVGAYYVDQIPTPDQLALPESTTVYFSDGVTPMARLGTENRTILAFDEMNDAVKQAIVAAEDRSFWTHSGVDLASVVRAAWNNVRGGRTQGASTITQQYARIAADLEGLTYARKAREALLAWKMDNRYSKEEILEFYLNTVPFGRGAYGIEAAAQAFFGRTVRTSAPVEQQVTVAEAMVLAGLVKQPEPDPTDPEGSPGYDPARGGIAAANAVSRWEYIREGMVLLGFLDRAEADALEFPHTVRDLSDIVSPDGLDRPTGLVVNHVLSELRGNAPFKDQAPDHIRNGGFRIVTTVDKRAQDAAESAADIRRASAPDAVRGQPANWQAALVAVEPGTGRVLAYYGGNSGTGADHAGWYVDEDGDPRGFGHHPPGSTFKVYDLAEALRQKVSLWSRWDSPSVKEFPNSGRTRGSRAGPVRNASSARCQPRCMLWEAAVASLNVPFFDLTERLGAANVIQMATRAGIDSMWTDGSRRTAAARVDLREKSARDVVAASAAAAGSGGKFWTEVGIGQYAVTVLDHANGMATFAAGGKRAPAHFVREVTRHGLRVYAETVTQSDIGLTRDQVDQLTWTLSQVSAARLSNGWEAAGKTGTWQAAASTTRNAHTWMVGYTTRLAVAVWVGTTDGKALVTRDGKTNVFGSTHPAPIWRQFLVEATQALAFDMKDRHFRTAKLDNPPPARR